MLHENSNKEPVLRTYDELNDIHIDELDFCGYAYDALVSRGIKTLSNLNGKTIDDLKLHGKPLEDFILKLGLQGVRVRENSHDLDKVKAVILGLAIADAMGVPVEFLHRETLAHNPVKGYRGHGTHDVPAGTWSDDTSMVLATLDSLANLDELAIEPNYTDIMERFCEWKNNAKYTATNEVFDMGITTNDALCRFEKGVPALECGGVLESDNGNGSLMRIAPAVLYVNSMYADTKQEDRIEIIHNVSALTHAHARSKIGCGIYAFILMGLLKNHDKREIMHSIKRAKSYYEEREGYTEELQIYSRIFNESFPDLPEYEIKSTGYVVYTLEAALWCILNTDSYAECVLKAVNLGKDTDTVAAVAGSLAAVVYGLDGIPKEWIEGLRNKELLLELCDRFVAGQNSRPSLMKDVYRISLHEKQVNELKTRERNKHIKYFAETMLSKFKNNDAAHKESRDLFSYSCHIFGFTIDINELCSSYRETFGSDFFTKINAKAFSRIAYKIKDVDMLGSVIFAKWRWVTHWTGDGAEGLIFDDNKAWFIAAFERLIEITSDPPVERKSFNYLIDVHGHYTFGVDDGATDMNMSMKMIRSAYEEGVREIICTSHSWGDMSRYKKNFDLLQKTLDYDGIDISIHGGCEIHCDEQSLPSIIEMLENDELPTLAGSKYVLLEFDQHVEGLEILRCVKQLGCSINCIPVIAHMERYYKLHNDENTLNTLRIWKVPIQINAYSLVEEKKENIKSFARELLDKKLVTFIGSDAHRTNHRSVNVKSGVEYIWENCDEEYAKDICFRNAEKMIFKLYS